MCLIHRTVSSELIAETLIYLETFKYGCDESVQMVTALLIYEISDLYIVTT